MPRLVITKGPDVGQDHAVGTECVVGRGADADFVLKDTNASRRHCRVLAEGDGYAIEDLGSRNGTFVDGTRVQRAPLTDGALVHIGSTEFVFRQKGLVASSTAGAARSVAVAPAVAVPPAISVPARPVPTRTVPGVPPAISVPPVVPAAPTAPTPAPRPAVSPIPTKRRRAGW